MSLKLKAVRLPASGWTQAAVSVRIPAMLAVAAALAVAGYLLASSRAAGLGFPLDDAWIHQTYARSLALDGQWAYWPGEPSAGSTSPLWSLLLALGYRLGLNPLAWTYLLGGSSLFALALTGQGFLRALSVERSQKVGLLPWAGLFLVGEWHLVWAAVSGMETIPYAVLILAVLVLISRASGRHWGEVGLLIGLGVWLRPDALTLLGPAGLVLLLAEKDWRSRGLALCWLTAGFLLLFGPYLWFNLQIQGSLWPNTFYAKQAEYAELLSLPWLQRYADQLKMPLIGAGVFLLPGFVRCLWISVRRRSWLGAAAGIWFLGFAGLYALRLPVVYQYGRYLIPAMPVFFILGLSGLMELVRLGSSRRPVWILTRTWAFSVVGVWLAFYGMVAGLYARDVAIIETEMVATARWVAVHTEPGALIAAHDIGALGYFGQRPLVDLAGLISPDVIPFMRDEAALAQWLDEQQVDYLVTFPGWYSHLTEGKSVVFKSGASYSMEAGGENMWVYRWRP